MLVGDVELEAGGLEVPRLVVVEVEVLLVRHVEIPLEVVHHCGHLPGA